MKLQALAIGLGLLAACAPTASRDDRIPAMPTAGAASSASVGQPENLAAPAYGSPWATRTLKRDFRSELTIYYAPLQKNAFDPFVSPDQKSIFYQSDPGLIAKRRTSMLGSERPVAGAVQFHRSAFAADGSSVILLKDSFRAPDNAGFLVLKLPDLSVLHRSDEGRDPLYASNDTVAFRVADAPMKLELTTGRATPAGKPLPEFGCAGYDNATGVSPNRDDCPGDHWSELIHVSSDVRRWLVVDRRVKDGGSTDPLKLRSVDVAAGSAESIYAWDAAGRVLLSPGRTKLCVQALVPKGRGSTIACGPPGGPLAQEAELSCHYGVRWLDDDSLLFVLDDSFTSDACKAQPKFVLWRFARRERIAIENRVDWDSGVIDSVPGGRFIVLNDRLLIDLHTGATWTLRRARGSIASALPSYYDVDPNDARYPEDAVLNRVTIDGTAKTFGLSAGERASER